MSVAEVSVADAQEISAPPPTPQQRHARRAAAARAARRRLRVVLTILVGLAVVGTLAVVGIVDPLYTLAPTGLLGAWLVACRLMVRKERGRPRAGHPPSGRRARAPPTTRYRGDRGRPGRAPRGAGRPRSPPRPRSPRRPGGWDPVPVTLPTYVAKEPAARRSVRTIDLDSTGVWSSGASAADSALAREAERGRARRQVRCRGDRAAPGGWVGRLTRPSRGDPSRFEAAPDRVLTFRFASLGAHSWGCGAVGSASRSQ